MLAVIVTKPPGEHSFHVIVRFHCHLILQNLLCIPTSRKKNLNPTPRPYIPHFYGNYAGFYFTAVSCYTTWVGPPPSDRGILIYEKLYITTSIPCGSVLVGVSPT